MFGALALYVESLGLLLQRGKTEIQFGNRLGFQCVQKPHVDGMDLRPEGIVQLLTHSGQMQCGAAAVGCHGRLLEQPFVLQRSNGPRYARAVQFQAFCQHGRLQARLLREPHQHAPFAPRDAVLAFAQARDEST